MPDIVRLRGFSTLSDGIALEFVEPVPTQIRCSTCGDIVGILWRSKCQHGFCTRCLENLLGQGSKSICPVDAADIRRNELTEDTSVQQAAAPLQVHCLNKETGCGEVLQIGTLNEHLQNCTVQSEVPARPPRRLDQSTPSTSTAQEPEEEVSCCRAMQPTTACWMSSLGCSFQGPRAELENHESDWESHRQLIVTRMSEYRRNMEDILAERDLLRNQLNEAHGTVKELKTNFERHLQECSARDDMLLLQLRDMSVRVTNVEQDNSSRRPFQDLRGGPDGDMSANFNAAANLPTAPSESQFGSMLSGFTMSNSSVVVTGHADDVVCPDGVFHWRLSEYGRAKRRERHAPKKYTSSPSFYTGTPGYHLKLRLFLNGIGQSRRGKFMAVNLVLMQGRHDAEVQWPFRQKVTVMLLDQSPGGQHVSYTINDPGFPRPQTDYTIPYVWQEFIAIDELERNGKYLCSDSICFKVIIEPVGGVYPSLLG
ncbi:TNF receptor-associated factor 3-like [Ornithodoros turicata]|uniref:TNF receptor-associated factor 3-like n=1 Tax=Ornithodoros turicata TaxID=34597 RepID=UPI0031393D3A